MSLPVGKVPRRFLESTVLRHLGSADRAVVSAPGVGLDASVVATESGWIVTATDPTLGVPLEHHGYFAFHYAASDVSVYGARPRWMMHTVLYPPGFKSSKLRDVVVQLDQECREWGVTILGGHTGGYDAVRELTSVSTMMGSVEEDKLVTPRGVKPGDAVLLTKGLGLETAVIAAAIREELKNSLPETLLNQLAGRIRELTCAKEALALAEAGLVHAMHDITEGGLSTCLHELAEVNELGFEIEAEKTLFPEDVQRVLTQLGFDPYACSSTGSLLAAVEPENVDEALQVLGKLGVRASVIGRFVVDSERRLIRDPSGVRRFAAYQPDPYASLWRS